MKRLIQTLAFITALATAVVAVRQVFHEDPPAQMRFGWVDSQGRYHSGGMWKII
jgi:hypothetical protein